MKTVHKTRACIKKCLLVRLHLIRKINHLETLWKDKPHAGTQGVWAPFSFVNGGCTFSNFQTIQVKGRTGGQHFPLVWNYFLLALTSI